VGKRNIRIQRHELPQRLREIEGKEVHVVMMDGKTHFGLLISADASALHLRDANAKWTSLRRHSQVLPLDGIMEVIFDLVTAY
jgi:hypothetical protein